MNLLIRPRPTLDRRRWLGLTAAGLAAAGGGPAGQARAEGTWEVTPDGEAALERGLAWLAANQGAEGSWGANDLGLIGLGALAFLAAGEMPGRGRYGKQVAAALAFITGRAKPSGLLNISNSQRDMYNHGLATFVLGQAHGMTGGADPRMSETLDRALGLIAKTQCGDGGWGYQARRDERGHDLSLVVMQAKALRSAVDSGLEVSPTVINLAIRCVREHYQPAGMNEKSPEDDQKRVRGQFCYSKGGGGASIAMAACGCVCLQEFGKYDDWRIGKNMDVITTAINSLPAWERRDGTMPFDAYTLYYVGQALYQVGGKPWKDHYGKLRDFLTRSQVVDPGNKRTHGTWHDRGHHGNARVGGTDGQLFATAVACFILAIPNRYLPILQEGRIAALDGR